jgi:hypothetical protein
MHTPGPWKFDSYGLKTGDARFFIETADNRHGIAGIRPTDTASALLSLKEHEANARLIAAAPDLFAVCQAYEEWEGDIVMNGDWGPDGMHPYPRLTEAQYQRMIEIQTMRNAAILKAKGSDA